MVEALRARQETEIAKVDTILEKLEAAPRGKSGNKEVDDDGVTMLRRLRGEMQDQIDA